MNGQKIDGLFLYQKVSKIFPDAELIDIDIIEEKNND